MTILNIIKKDKPTAKVGPSYVPNQSRRNMAFILRFSLIEEWDKGAIKFLLSSNTKEPQ